MRKKLIIISVLVVMSLLGWFIYKSTTLFVVRTTPENNLSQVSLDTKISISFSKEIDANAPLSITINPEQALETSVDGKVLNIITGLQADTKYTVLVEEIHSTNKKTLNNYQLTFRSGVVDIDIAQKRQSIKRILPHTTSSYSIDYVLSSDLYVIDIYMGPVAQVKKEALLFLSEYLITEETDNIEFYIIPSVSGNSGP